MRRLTMKMKPEKDVFIGLQIEQAEEDEVENEKSVECYLEFLSSMSSLISTHDKEFPRRSERKQQHNEDIYAVWSES